MARAYYAGGVEVKQRRKSLICCVLEYFEGWKGDIYNPTFV